MGLSEAAAQRRVEIGQERRRRTVKRLIEAAARVVASRGEAAATIDDFIRAAGVARGTFYNHFETREDLLAALWAHIGSRPFQAIQTACSAMADPAESLAAEARLVIRRAGRDAVWGWLVYSSSSSGDTLNEDLRAYPRDVLRRGLERKRFAFSSLDAASDLVVSAVRMGMHGVLTGVRRQRHGEDLCTLLLTALGLDRAEAAAIATRALPKIEG